MDFQPHISYFPREIYFLFSRSRCHFSYRTVLSQVPHRRDNRPVARSNVVIVQWPNQQPVCQTGKADLNKSGNYFIMEYHIDWQRDAHYAEASNRDRASHLTNKCRGIPPRFRRSLWQIATSENPDLGLTLRLAAILLWEIIFRRSYGIGAVKPKRPYAAGEPMESGTDRNEDAANI